jgi:hypothetical protein
LSEAGDSAFWYLVSTDVEGRRKLREELKLAIERLQNPFHRVLRNSNQSNTTESPLRPIVKNFFLLHPIALLF